MKVEGLHETGLFVSEFPFRLTVNTQENFDYPLHWHSAIEIVYVKENHYRLVLNDNELLLDEKDILFIPGGEIHGFNVNNSIGKRYFIQFDLSGLDGFGGMYCLKPFLKRNRIISFQKDKTLHQIIEGQILKLIDEYEKKDFAYALAINARIYDIMIFFCRDVADKYVTGKDITGKDITGKDVADKINNIVGKTIQSKNIGLERINLAFEYIEKNYQNDITLKDVSRAAGFSECHFSRLFKKITERNFHRYLNEYRIKMAEKLLLKGGKSITQIAYESGFSSITTFNRLFREINGCAPGLYRM